MAREPELLAVTDLGNGSMRVRVRASTSDGTEFSAVLGLPMRVNGHLYRVSFAAFVPGSGRASVPELLDLTLRLVNED
ncbi:hypothetical protein FOHLNKBM_5626 [Methylobacterium longum]|nr:hypothetical protein FOHLNKBM_5626 [Methylobacterium longum]